MLCLLASVYQSAYYILRCNVCVACRLVTAAIREAGLQDHPTDYLQFFCLGKREPHDTHPGGVRVTRGPERH